MRGSSKRTAAPAGTGSGGKGDTKGYVSLSHNSSRKASQHITQNNAFASKGIKQDAPLTALLKHAIAVADRQDEKIADLASLSLRYGNLMDRGCGKEIVLQPWPRGDCWLMIRDGDGSGSRLEYRGSFANAFRLALLHSVYGGDDVRGARIGIVGEHDYA